MHHRDLPAAVAFNHHEIQQSLSLRAGIALCIYSACHLPLDIDSRDIGTQEASFDVGVFLVAFAEDSGEDGRVEGLNVCAAARADAANVGEIRVFGKYRRKRLSIVMIPRVHETVHHCADGVLLWRSTSLTYEQKGE